MWTMWCASLHFNNGNVVIVSLWHPGTPNERNYTRYIYSCIHMIPYIDGYLVEKTAMSVNGLAILLVLHVYCCVYNIYICLLSWFHQTLQDDNIQCNKNTYLWPFHCLCIDIRKKMKCLHWAMSIPFANIRTYDIRTYMCACTHKLTWTLSIWINESVSFSHCLILHVILS